jgi:hypothetical protein
MQKYFSLPSLLCFTFCNPTNKTETGTANSWGGSTNSKPPGPIIMMGESDTGTTSQFMIITLFSGRLFVGRFLGYGFEL